jgi:hypothetical protein
VYVATAGFWPHDPLGKLAGQAKEVELKLVVPGRDGRSLGIDTERGAERVVWFRDRPGRDDAVVKLRPVRPGRVPGWLRGVDEFRMEIDALPGRAVCSGALKERLRRNAVSRALKAGRPLTTLLSSRQRRLLAKYAPDGVRLGDLVVYGPIAVRCRNVKVRGLKGGLTAERWSYPDGSALLELSTKCRVREAKAVAARVSTALRAYGVTPADEQRTKTEVALSAA